MSAPGCSGVIAWCPMCWARSRIPRARACRCSARWRCPSPTTSMPTIGICNTCWARPCWCADHRARQERAGVPAQGRRLVGPEHGPSLRRRHHLDAGVRTGQFPVFGREGHMLCLGPAAQHTGEFNSARILDEVWMFGMPVHNPLSCATRSVSCRCRARATSRAWKACASRRPRGWRSSAAAPRSVSRGRAERQGLRPDRSAPRFSAQRKPR